MEEKKPAPQKPAPKKAEEKKKPHMMFVPSVIGIIGFVVFMVTAPYWATDIEDARATLMASGYTPIKVGGFDHFGCGLDLYATKFVATSPKGFKVKGNVCKTPHINPSTIEETTD